ncbi:hypothetical protein VTO73DRAFT_13816 [Trametes versicolor]
MMWETSDGANLCMACSPAEKHYQSSQLCTATFTDPVHLVPSLLGVSSSALAGEHSTHSLSILLLSLSPGTHHPRAIGGPTEKSARRRPASDVTMRLPRRPISAKRCIGSCHSLKVALANSVRARSSTLRQPGGLRREATSSHNQRQIARHAASYMKTHVPSLFHVCAALAHTFR